MVSGPTKFWLRLRICHRAQRLSTVSVRAFLGLETVKLNLLAFIKNTYSGSFGLAFPAEHLDFFSMVGISFSFNGIRPKHVDFLTGIKTGVWKWFKNPSHQFILGCHQILNFTSIIHDFKICHCFFFQIFLFVLNPVQSMTKQDTR